MVFKSIKGFNFIFLFFFRSALYSIDFSTSTIVAVVAAAAANSDRISEMYLKPQLTAQHHLNLIEALKYIYMTVYSYIEWFQLPRVYMFKATIIELEKYKKWWNYLNNDDKWIWYIFILCRTFELKCVEWESLYTDFELGMTRERI